MNFISEPSISTMSVLMSNLAPDRLTCFDLSRSVSVVLFSFVSCSLLHSSQPVASCAVQESSGSSSSDEWGGETGRSFQ